MRRRKTTRENRVAHLEERLAVLWSEIEGLETEGRDLDSKLAALREDEAKAYIGDADPEEVSRRRHEIESRLSEVAVETDRKRGLVEPLQRELAKAEKALADSRSATAKNGWLEDLYAQHEAGTALQKKLREAAKAGEALEGARRKAAESRSLYEVRCRDADEETDDLPGIADEPAWDEGCAGLKALLQAGPLRPAAQARSERERWEAGLRRQRREVVYWWSKQPTWRIERDCPEEMGEEALRLKAERDAENTLEKIRERNIAAARAHGHAYSEGGELLYDPARDR